MDIMNSSDLKSLISQKGKWCVSLYMPTHRRGRDQQQDPVRLKNLLAQAETELLATGMRRPEVHMLLEPAEQLLQDRSFWQHQGKGLAIFLTHGRSTVYRLSAVFEPLLIIGHNFHIKPLLPLLARTEKFYLLALSLGNVRLFEATADTMSAITLSFPTSIDESQALGEPEKFINLHSGSSGTYEGRSAAPIFHGHDSANETKDNILRFFRSVNEGINALIEDKTVPMLLAGVEYLLALYREANTYQNLLKTGLSGNPDREDLKELQARARSIVQPIFDEPQSQASEKYGQLSGQQSTLASQDLDIIVKAARFGQVQTLFVPLDEYIWGRYDDRRDQVIVDPEPTPENEDLLNSAAAQTILSGGQVFAVPRQELPGGGDLAAILRYAVPQD